MQVAVNKDISHALGESHVLPPYFIPRTAAAMAIPENNVQRSARGVMIGNSGRCAANANSLRFVLL